LVLVGTAVSCFGYLRRERKEDWRGVTEYLLKVPEKQRLSVIVPDIAQVLVQYYASGSSKSYPSTEVTGLLTGFNPPDPNLEDRILRLQDDPNVDVLALASQAMASGRYKEIDVAIQPGTSPFLIKPMLEHLQLHCNSVDLVQFNWLDVRRCRVENDIRR
jgi:hypothetical protein